MWSLRQAPSFKFRHRFLFFMPRTLELVCEDDDCTLDMFELHYTYEMPEDTGVGDFACPYCGSSKLREIDV